jgi:hypothetical protein
MNSPSSNETKSKCLSDYQLDCLAFQSADALPESPSMAAHLLLCGQCQARLHDVRNALPPADLNRLLHAAEQYEADKQSESLWRDSRWLPPLSVLAAAAVVALFLWPAPKPSLVGVDSQSERTKGGALHLNVIRHTVNGHVERVVSGDIVNPHDSLRFEVESPSDAYISVVSIDASHAVTAFVPTAGDAVFVKGNSVALLEGAVILDDVAGDEEIFLVACRAPFAVEEAVRSLASLQNAETFTNDQTKRLTLAQGACDLRVVSLQKQVKK